MGFMTIKQLKVFKSATGDDTIAAEFKGKDIFDFEFKGFLWFCANREPKFNGDKGDHVYRRMMIVRCDNVIPVEKQDKKLIDKINSGEMITDEDVKYQNELVANAG